MAAGMEGVTRNGPRIVGLTITWLAPDLVAMDFEVQLPNGKRVRRQETWPPARTINYLLRKRMPMAFPQVIGQTMEVIRDGRETRNWSKAEGSPACGQGPTAAG